MLHSMWSLKYIVHFHTRLYFSKPSGLVVVGSISFGGTVMFGGVGGYDGTVSGAECVCGVVLRVWLFWVIKEYQKVSFSVIAHTSEPDY